MHKYRITYMRSSYMEMEITAKNSREAEARFNMLAAKQSSACEWGNPLMDPHYRIVDVTGIQADDRAQDSAARRIEQRRANHARPAASVA